LQLSTLLVVRLLSVSLVVTPAAVDLEGVPRGFPAAPIAVSVVQVDQTAGINSDIVARWQAPVDNHGNIIDGSTPITGYVAVVMSGTDFTIPIASPCTAPSSTDATYVFTCRMTGLGYGHWYKLRVFATNIMGSSPLAWSAPFLTPALTQTVTINDVPTCKTFGDPRFVLTARASSGLPVSWFTETPEVCVVGSSGVVELVGAGSCTITVAQNALGSHCADASTQISFPVSISPKAFASGATKVQGNGATLNAIVPYPGAPATSEFCISATNSQVNCAPPWGVTIGSAEPAVITAISKTAVSAPVFGLLSDTTYYYWVKVAAGTSSVTSPNATFHTRVGAFLSLSGSTLGTVNQSMMIRVMANGGSGIYLDWLAISLPAGLMFSPAEKDSTISGIPRRAGDFASVVSVTDDVGVTTRMDINFTIKPSPTSAPTSTPTLTSTSTPTSTPTPTPPGTILAHVHGPLPAMVPIPNISSSSVVVIAKGNPKSVNGVAGATELDGVLTLTPISTFSGTISLPITVTTLGDSVHLIVELTVNPAAVRNSTHVPKSANSTTVTWTRSPNAIGYQVLIDGKRLCSTSATECNAPRLVGPNSKIEVTAFGNDGTISARTLAAYVPVKPVEISSVNFASSSSVIDATAKKKLLAFIALFKAQGFRSISIVGYTDNQGEAKGSAALATARAKSTRNFLAKYLKVPMQIDAQGIKAPIASNKTKAGQAQNRRAAVLVK
jgi:outer membrane protein OmpA-like peptidoglycan-associated protein